MLFLDEPTTGLDPRSRNGLWAVIRELVAEGTTLLLTTQYMEEADHLAGHIAVIDHGQVIATGTPDELKAKIGTGAYFVAAAKALGRLPVPMRIRIDNHRVHHRRAMICVVGNVGTLAGNIVLIPGAKPDDGMLDVYIASPHRFTQWVRVFLRLLTRRRQNGDRVDQWRGRRVEVALERPDNYQLDGDVVGELRRLVAEIQPQALSVRVPA